MVTFITRRVLQTIVIMVGLSMFFFWLLHQVPGGPCDGYLSGGTQAGIQRYNQCLNTLGLNKSVPEQYILWVRNVAHFDFGQSFSVGRPVGDEILARAPATLLLAGFAYLIQELIAIPLGIFAALKRYSFFDSIFTVATYIGLSMPSFFLAGLLILVFAVLLGWFPAGGIVGDTTNIPTFNGTGYWAYFAHHPWHALSDFFAHLVLPAATLAVIGIAGDSRYMRASMLDVINQDYVRTARAKGLSRRSVVLKHALRNALLPIITNVALALPQLIGGAIITETIFGWPGMGQLTSHALVTSDYPVLQATLMIGAAGILIGNLCGDLTYAWVDPRIRYD